MTDRTIVYTGAIPLDTDLLRTQRFGVEGLGRLAGSVFGTNTVVDGLTVEPTSPASLAVMVQPGVIMQALPLDASAYGALAADSHTILQQAIMRDAVTMAITPPAVAGQSRVYLVQAGVSIVDRDPTVLPYYNAANPSLALSGPNNSGTPQNTTRAAVVTVNLKAGSAAATGSAVPPLVDAGWVALATVTVANGASSVTVNNIATLATVPRLAFNLFAGSAALAALVSGAGLTPDGTAGQPLDAIRTFLRAPWNALGAVGSTLLAPPSWARYVESMVIGGGGGGGGTGTPGTGGGGGGAGGFAWGIYAVNAGGAITATVGAGGYGSGSAGGSGGTSSLGSLLSATGGSGGGAYSTYPAGGSGGLGAGGTIMNAYGNAGSDGGSSAAFAGNGGSAPYFSIGSGRGGSGGGVAASGVGAGGGGAYITSGGSASAVVGGSGAQGLIMYRWIP